jgi:hypothetical protein
MVQLVGALHHKTEGREFDPRRGVLLYALSGPESHSASNTDTMKFPWG